MAQATATKVGDRRPPLELPDTERRRPHPADARRGAGDGGDLDLQPLPLRARLARAAGQVARDYAPAGVRFLAVNSNDAERYPVTRSRRCASGSRGGLAVPVPPRREPAGGA